MPIPSRCLRRVSPPQLSRISLTSSSVGRLRDMIRYQRPFSHTKYRQDKTPPKRSCRSAAQADARASEPLVRAAFWCSRSTWRRAALNTFRCLIGCTAGDFSSMWYLQAFHPDVGMPAVMSISMVAGVSTSLLLETALLRYGRDRLPWAAAAKTAAGMSTISMLTMELAENAVDYHLTGGVVDIASPSFWLAALVSVAAGFMAPLPYNYIRLRKYGKSCH